MENGRQQHTKMMTYNETRLIVAIADLIISEGLSFNLSQKPRFKKVLEFDDLRPNRRWYFEGELPCGSSMS